MAQAHDGHQCQKKAAYQTPVDLLIQPLGQWTDERLQQIGNIQPLPLPHPMRQHMKRPLPVNGVVTFPFHQKGSYFASDFLYRFYCLSHHQNTG